ncbi:hypothetical protein PILCRDRAFT_2197 [Piloderma croceum F 1598]|uniref:Uncharacterized protein n=1 Tax=Piloderma croceum (strain F 1598) TaxID=765440 RepID=A0A0C3GH30_PILCF|nr:hypothetical protein PILCRDRAFT_2197 [Piloderma croceum F 1598]
MGLCALVSTPGIIDILTKHWLEETKYMQHWIELAKNDPRFAGALAVLLLRQDDISPRVITSMLQAAGGNNDFVARVATEQLQYSLTREAGRDNTISSVHRHLCLIIFLSHSTFDKHHLSHGPPHLYRREITMINKLSYGVWKL